MPVLKQSLYDLTSTPKTNHYIETGAYLGHGIMRVIGEYNNIHSIELSEKWYNHNVEQFKNHPSVKMHLGDSKKVLPHLLSTLAEPVTIYLDAHYSGGPTAFGDEETPLLHELKILKSREYDDIIIIDDCRLLGNKGACGDAGCSVYPPMNFDWSDITDDKIVDCMKDGYILVKNTNNEFTCGAPDQYILIKAKTL
jgi:hypothetical protein